MTTPIVLEKAKTGIAAYREKKGLLPGVVRVLTSTKTTAVLGATLATLATAGAVAPAATGAALRSAPSLALKGAKALVPKTAKGVLTAAVGVPTAVGVLKSSAKAREAAKNVINPARNIARGEKLGKIIEDPSKAEDILGISPGASTKERILQGLKTAGKFGAIAGLATAGVAGVKKLVDRRKERKALETSEPTLGVLPEALPARVGVSSLKAPPSIEQAQTPVLESQASPAAVSDERKGIQPGYPLTIVQVKI